MTKQQYEAISGLIYVGVYLFLFAGFLFAGVAVICVTGNPMSSIGMFLAALLWFFTASSLGRSNRANLEATPAAAPQAAN